MCVIFFILYVFKTPTSDYLTSFKIFPIVNNVMMNLSVIIANDSYHLLHC